VQTPNKDNVEEMMEAFQRALSQDDMEMMVRMAQEEESNDVKEVNPNQDDK
jgi:diketogulonate reductase-like aldo/keto reductase